MTDTATPNTPNIVVVESTEKDIHGRPLTEREKQVLTELAAGHTNEQTSKAMGISIKTVEAHRARLFKKLGAANAPQAIVYAYQQGWMKSPLSVYTTDEIAKELAQRSASANPSPAQPS